MTASAAKYAVWIADSTPLIVLAKIGHLALIEAFSDEVWVPQTVADEVLAGGEGDPARQALEAGWGQRMADVPQLASVQALRIDPGEAAVLALALSRPGAVAILDDGKARTAAKRMGVAVIETLGIIARAKAEAYIPAARPLIEALLRVQFRADDALLAMVLQRLGEEWPGAPP